jgi:hypothetical protein
MSKQWNSVVIEHSWWCFVWVSVFVTELPYSSWSVRYWSLTVPDFLLSLQILGWGYRFSLWADLWYRLFGPLSGYLYCRFFCLCRTLIAVRTWMSAKSMLLWCCISLVFWIRVAWYLGWENNIKKHIFLLYVCEYEKANFSAFFTTSLSKSEKSFLHQVLFAIGIKILFSERM